MSDNPADSLRTQLEVEVMKAIHALWCKVPDCIHSAREYREGYAAVAAIWPLVEAARADERERLQQENQELRAALKEANQANERLLMALDSGGV